MATNTTNFNLIKPAYTDTADIADINGNMDKVDVSLNGLADAIAIVANNNTHAAITTGQYVYVHGHGSLAEGLYTAKSNIAANATLSTSNLQADSSGGLNSVYSTLNTKTVDYVDIADSSPVNITNKTSETGNTVYRTNFISAVCQDTEVICLPYYNSTYDKLYCLLKDTNLNNVTGTKTIRIYYKR